MARRQNAEEEMDHEPEEEEGAEESNEESEEDSEDAPEPEPERIRLLNAEAKKHRLRAKELAQKLHAAADQIAELQKQDGVFKELEQKVKTLTLRLSYNDLAHELNVTYRDDAWDKVAGDLQSAMADDGTVDEDKARSIVETAIEQHPWIRSAEGENGEEPGDRAPRPKSPFLGGAKKQSRDTAIAALAKKYPALLDKRMGR